MVRSRKDEGQYYGWAVICEEAEPKKVAVTKVTKGGPGSGNWGHAGRRGQRGGSLPKSTAMSIATGATAAQRQQGAKVMGQVGDEWAEIGEIAERAGVPVGDAVRALSTAELHGDVQYRKEGWDVQYRKTPESEKPKPGPTEAQLRKLAKETLNAERTGDDTDYYISLLDKPEGGWGKKTWSDGMRYEKVKGIPVQIPGTEKADLFVHRPYGSTTGWMVSEGRSGSSITKRESTRKKAVEAAEVRIRAIGGSKRFMERLPEVITHSIMKFGQPWRSPRYGGKERYGPSGVRPWRPGVPLK